MVDRAVKVLQDGQGPQNFRTTPPSTINASALATQVERFTPPKALPCNLDDHQQPDQGSNIGHDDDDGIHRQFGQTPHQQPDGENAQRHDHHAGGEPWEPGDAIPAHQHHEQNQVCGKGERPQDIACGKGK